MFCRRKAQMTIVEQKARGSSYLIRECRSQTASRSLIVSMVSNRYYVMARRLGQRCTYQTWGTSLLAERQFTNHKPCVRKLLDWILGDAYMMELDTKGTGCIINGRKVFLERTGHSGTGMGSETWSGIIIYLWKLLHVYST